MLLLGSTFASPREALAPRPPVCRNRPLKESSIIDTKIEELHRAALFRFGKWIFDNTGGVALDIVIQHPEVIYALLVRYCQFLWRGGYPLYHYLMTLTAVQRQNIHFRLHLKEAWQMSTNWRLEEPVSHRTPVPIAIVQALIGL